MPTDMSKLQATVEDCTSDDDREQGVRIEAFTPDQSPGKANVRTKRSNPEDMGTDKTPTGRVPNNCDVKSDSGYSSQSVAGMSSADSAASATSSQRSPPVVPARTVPAAPSPTPAQRAPRPSHQRQHSTQTSQSASRPPPSRRDSHASQTSRRPPTADRPERPERLERRPTLTQPVPKRRDSQRADKDDCTVPGCTTCGPDAIPSRPRQSRRQSMLNTQPTESAPDVSYPHTIDTRSQVSDPAQYQASSPREGRLPRYHAQQGGPVIQPAISRRLSVNSRPARPTSYHGDPNHNYQQPPMHLSYPSPPERGPPPSRSAQFGIPYGQPQMNTPYMPPFPSQNPHPTAFYQAQQMQPQPMYEPQRPPLQARASTSGYPPQPHVQVARSDRNMPSARYHPNSAPAQPHVQRQQPRLEHRNQQEYDESASESESETESEEDQEQDYREAARRLMAPLDPRPLRTASKRRPSLRHANTTPAPPAPEPRPRRPQAIIVPELPRSERRESRVHDRAKDLRPHRRSSMSRPPLVPSIKSQSAYDTPQARVIVEGSRSSHRKSLQTYDRTVQEHRQPRQQEYNEQRRHNRTSKIHDNAIDYEREFDDEEEEEAAPPLRRRGTDADSRRRPHRPVEVKQAADAESYINARRGDFETYADQTYEIAKKRSSRISGPSEAESSRSRGSNENGEIRLRIGNDAPVTLSLNGDMEGRTLQLVPIDDKMNELVISSNGRGESVYPSERGSTRGERRAIMPASQSRRDAEEMTERSSHSSRRRRDSRVIVEEPRQHVLQRRSRKDRDTQYRQ